MKNFIKLFIVLLCCISLFGCTKAKDTIDLREGEIAKKTTYNDSFSKYEIINNNDQGYCFQYIYASPDFAEQGDIIGSKDGVIKVIKKAIDVK